MSLTDWIGAVGTTGATLIAAGALAVQQYDRRRQVPGAVNGSVVIENGSATSVVFANPSDTPVFDVVARVVFNGETIPVTSLDSLPPRYQESIPLPDARGIWARVADLNVIEQGPKLDWCFRDPWGRVWRKKSDVSRRRQRRTYRWADEYHRALNETPTGLDQETIEPLRGQRHASGSQSG